MSIRLPSYCDHGEPDADPQDCDECYREMRALIEESVAWNLVELVAEVGGLCRNGIDGKVHRMRSLPDQRIDLLGAQGEVLGRVQIACHPDGNITVHRVAGDPTVEAFVRQEHDS